MSRKSNKNYNRSNMNYNRQSGGYQKNLYRQKLNAEGLGKPPKAVDQKKLRIGVIAAGVIWLIIGVLLVIKLKWIGLLIAVLIGAAVVGGIYLFLRNKQNEMVRYYKKMGMTEEMYISELKKRTNSSPKEIETFRKVWRRVKVD